MVSTRFKAARRKLLGQGFDSPTVHSILCIALIPAILERNKMPVDKNKRMQPPKNQNFKAGFSILMNVGRPDKNGTSKQRFARFSCAEELSIFYMENSRNKDSRDLR